MVDGSIKEIKVGQKVPDLKVTYYDPQKKGFGQMNLYDLLQQGKWVVFFFYPADFTFVFQQSLQMLAKSMMSSQKQM